MLSATSHIHPIQSLGRALAGCDTLCKEIMKQPSSLLEELALQKKLDELRQTTRKTGGVVRINCGAHLPLQLFFDILVLLRAGAHAVRCPTAILLLSR